MHTGRKNRPAYASDIGKTLPAGSSGRPDRPEDLTTGCQEDGFIHMDFKCAEHALPPWTRAQPCAHCPAPGMAAQLDGPVADAGQLPGVPIILGLQDG